MAGFQKSVDTSSSSRNPGRSSSPILEEQPSFQPSSTSLPIFEESLKAISDQITSRVNGLLDGFKTQISEVIVSVNNALQDGLIEIRKLAKTVPSEPQPHQNVPQTPPFSQTYVPPSSSQNPLGPSPSSTVQSPILKFTRRKVAVHKKKLSRPGSASDQPQYISSSDEDETTKRKKKEERRERMGKAILSVSNTARRLRLIGSREIFRLVEEYLEANNEEWSIEDANEVAIQIRDLLSIHETNQLERKRKRNIDQ